MTQMSRTLIARVHLPMNFLTHMRVLSTHYLCHEPIPGKPARMCPIHTTESCGYAVSYMFTTSICNQDFSRILMSALVAG